MKGHPAARGTGIAYMKSLSCRLFCINPFAAPVTDARILYCGTVFVICTLYVIFFLYERYPPIFESQNLHKYENVVIFTTSFNGRLI